jgi:hypothetical protein
MAVSLCEGSVKDNLHIAESALTYTEVEVDEVDDHSYTVDGYVNQIEFSCIGIRFDKDGFWDQSLFRVDIGGVTVEEGE